MQLTRAFYLGEKEVTNAEFRRFRAAHDSGVAEGTSLNGDEQPVVNVSWEDAARYCNWLSALAGLPPGARSALDLETLPGLAREDIDAVTISSPDFWHAGHGVAAASWRRR